MRIGKIGIKKSPWGIAHKIKRLLNTCYYIILYRNTDYIIVNCSVEQWFGKLKQINLGDELNIYLLEEITGKKVVSSLTTFFPKKYSVIGSVVETLTSHHTIIWGSGAIEGIGKKLKKKPLKVLSVRGKLTRDYLLYYGVKCPEIYGDPALLLPCIYNPVIKKKYKCGIIPHVTDLYEIAVQVFVANNPEVHLISFANYGDWHKVINEIMSCEMIISSSLHGIIISDAYGIPNVWMKVSNNIIGGDFKYKDYFSSVGREIKAPLILTVDSQIKDIEACITEYKPISIDLNEMLKVCPFEIQGLNEHVKIYSKP